MKKFRHGLMIIGLVLVVWLIVALSIRKATPTSLAYSAEGGAFAYVPIILKSEIPTATPIPTMPATETATHVPTMAPTQVPTQNPTIPATQPATAVPTSDPPFGCDASPLPPTDGPIVVDHTSIVLFEHIPEQYLQAAASTDMFYMDRSVGGNINDGLTCLGYESNELAPSGCVNNNHPNPDYQVEACELEWSREGGYDRSNWDFEFWEEGCGQWFDKVDCFMSRAEQLMNQYDVLSYQFSYLAVSQNSSIIDQPGGFFYDNSNRSDVVDLEAFEAQHPDKTFIYWTTSLARSIGTEEADAFNEQMRQYAQDNDKILFDVAAILAHDPEGNPCYDNQDDGVDHLAICPHYTTEANGGHLGSVSAGKIRVAKAFWVLMAQIAGWEPTL